MAESEYVIRGKSGNLVVRVTYIWYLLHTKSDKSRLRNRSDPCSGPARAPNQQPQRRSLAGIVSVMTVSGSHGVDKYTDRAGFVPVFSNPFFLSLFLSSPFHFFFLSRFFPLCTTRESNKQVSVSYSLSLFFYPRREILFITTPFFSFFLLNYLLGLTWRLARSVFFAGACCGRSRLLCNTRSNGRK